LITRSESHQVIPYAWKKRFSAKQHEQSGNFYIESVRNHARIQCSKNTKNDKICNKKRKGKTQIKEVTTNKSKCTGSRARGTSEQWSVVEAAAVGDCCGRKRQDCTKQLVRLIRTKTLDSSDKHFTKLSEDKLKQNTWQKWRLQTKAGKRKSVGEQMHCSEAKVQLNRIVRESCENDLERRCWSCVGRQS
jgi:hypothetical protein